MPERWIGYLAAFAALFFLSGALFYAGWRLRAAGRRTLATQRAIAERAHLQTHTPQTQDWHWDDRARHHGGGL